MKRAFDFIVSLFLLVVMLPVIAFIALLILFNLGSPILFVQTRPGLDCKEYEMVKFRTMSTASDESGEILDDNDRLSPFGKFLRSSSLDELPELFNVIKGEMSLVGPRPLLIEYLELYDQEQIKRHDVKPGITGWAQINGRNNLEWDEKFELDLWYVKNQSFFLDMKILVLSIKKVILREGINTRDNQIMPPFLGNSKEKFNKSRSNKDPL